MAVTTEIGMSVADLCHQADFESAAAALTGWRGIGLRPHRSGQNDPQYAESLQWAAVISVELSLAKQIPIGDSARDMLTESARLSTSAEPLVWLGICYYRCGEYDEAGAMLTAALESELSDSGKFVALRNLAVVQTYKDQLETALKTLAMAELLFDAAPTIGKGRLHLQRGLIYRRLCRLNDAIREYEKAERCFEEGRYRRFEAMVSNNLAGIFCDQENYIRAHVYAQRAVSLFESLKDKLNSAKSWDQIARIYLAEGNLDSAERATRKAVAYVEFGEQGQVLAECLITQGHAFSRRGLTLAQESLTKAAEICAKIGDKKQAQEANRELAELVKRSRDLISSVAVALRPVERQVIRESLVRHNGVVSHVAAELKMPNATLRKKIERQFPELLTERKPIVKRRKGLLGANSHNPPKRG